MNNTESIEIHKSYMEQALIIAKQSGNEIPVGAIIVKDGVIVAGATNRKEQDNDVTAHAEILAIKEASKKLNCWRLNDCTLYVTLEPCPMCAAAILYSRIPNVVFGAYDQLYGAFGSSLDMTKHIKHSPKITGGIKEEECKEVIKTFFEKVRK